MVYKTVVIFHWKSVCLLCAASASYSVGVQRINGFSDFNLFHELFLLLCLTIGNSIVLLCLVPLRYIEMFFNLSTLNNYFAFFFLWSMVTLAAFYVAGTLFVWSVYAHWLSS